MSGIIKIWVILAFVCLVQRAKAQDTIEMWVNLSPELKIGFEDRIWEIRFRPDDHIFLPSKYVATGNQAKAELMLGFNFWKFKLFSHSKYDQNHAFWTGVRFDLNFSALNSKLLFNIQERYFFGLNNKAKDHYYLIQYIRYKIAAKSAFGVLLFGKWNTGRNFNTGNWFMGPSLAVEDPSSLGIQLAILKDAFHKQTYMTFLRISYSIEIKNKSKPINFNIDD
jgi:hypothetical protein